MKFNRRELRLLYGALSLAVLMEETSADANRGVSWHKPDAGMRAECRRAMLTAATFKKMQERIGEELRRGTRR